MELIFWFFGVASFFAASQYVFGPLLVLKNHRIPKQFNFELLEGDLSLRERSENIENLHEELLSSGFVYVGSSELNQSNSAIKFSVYYSLDKCLTCTIAYAEAAGLTATTQLEFTQMYDDNSMLSVNNNSIFSVYPEWEGKQCYRFPDVNSFPELLSTCEALIEINAKDKTVKPMKKGKVFETIEKFLNEETARLISLGWIASDAVGEQYKLSPKGALLMTWKMCWPLKSVIDRADRARTLRALS